MPSRYSEYKKRRLVKLQQRIQELEDEIKLLRAELVKSNNENVELKSEIYYFKTHVRR
jgi:predicted  nucleic acid-binding Zn-ribbon protein